MPEIHPHDTDWLNKQLYGIPDIFKQDILADYLNKPSRREANLSVLAERKAIANILGKDAHHYHININDRDCTQAAKIHSRHCLQIQINNPALSLCALYRLTVSYINQQGVSPHPLSAKTLTAIEAGILTNKEAIKVNGVLNRAKDPDWWRKKLKTQHIRQLETLSRRYNRVNKQKGIYISSLSLSHIQNRWKDNQSFLQETIATNEDGYSTNLAELSNLNVSNPAIRRAELMVRTRGFEECAKALSHTALFLTMTCPSRYHRSLSKSGSKNPNWDGATPLDAQQYLCLTFSRIRAALGHQGISIFGFRVAEPHHDGTPHWHLLLFIKPENEAALIDIFRHYCFEENGNEPGAAKHRFTVERIDPNKGSATGYIAKYIAKNVDGEGIAEDSYGKEAKESAIRVRAWASCWGIRQFQQLGGVSVSVWRELRRLEAIKEAELDWIEEIRQLADASDWQGYTERMGGVFCKRNDQTIRPLYQAVTESNWNPQLLREQLPEQSRNKAATEILEFPAHAAPECERTEKETGHENPESDSGLSGKTGNLPPEMQDNTANLIQHDSKNIPETAITNPEMNQQAFREVPPQFPNQSGEIPEAKTNRYGDEQLTRLKGIVSLGVEIITRVHEWTMSHAPSSTRLSLEYCQ